MQGVQGIQGAIETRKIIPNRDLPVHKQNMYINPTFELLDAIETMTQSRGSTDDDQPDLPLTAIERPPLSKDTNIKTSPRKIPITHLSKVEIVDRNERKEKSQSDLLTPKAQDMTEQLLQGLMNM